MLVASRTRFLFRSLIFNGFRSIATSNRANYPIEPGDKLPAVDLYKGDPGTKVNIADLKGKVVIFGVPGAFTPTCDKDHAPSFIKNADALKEKGVQSIVCLSVNDPFVMGAWKNSLGGGNKVRFLADTCADFVTKACMSLDLTSVLGNVRCRRFALVAEDGIVKHIQVEPDGTGLTCSKADDVLKVL
ncbi:peroxiredoxin-5, mitochondrial-like [Babylonia areolata]|uniref:peroxiredoxin-5, mitochondrial-like n=1 Tax=Babylonia areolata TaxID=304850 RepID=UPI003FD515B5